MEKQTPVKVPFAALGLFALGAAAGAVTSFLLDPENGRHRRTLILDKGPRIKNEVSRFLSQRSRDLTNRARGLAFETANAFHFGHEEVDDETLVARVRSQLGRCSSHPHAIRVEAKNGYVTLRGPILASEVGDLTARLRAVRGVVGLDSALDVHESSAHISALQDGSHEKKTPKSSDVGRSS